MTTRSVSGRHTGLRVLTAAILTAGCSAPAAQESQAASATPAVTASASASATATSTPTATPEPTGTPAASLGYEAPQGLLPPGSRVVVVVDALQLRSEPGLDGPAVGTASAGAEYFAIFPGPMEVDGISWNLLIALEGGFSAWAASGSGPDRYLELVPPDCPSAQPDLAALTTMLEWDRLACFGDRSLTFEGTFGCPEGCGADYFGSFEPLWLAHPRALNPLWVDYPSSNSMEMHLSPDSGLTFPQGGSVVRVTGHFNDPASTSCRIATGDPITVDPRTAELYCRERFVVDAFEVIGTNPEFP